ncbi:MAG: hypothetical protein AAGA48_00810 [Myxococcota bacterium]
MLIWTLTACFLWDGDEDPETTVPTRGSEATGSDSGAPIADPTGETGLVDSGPRTDAITIELPGEVDVLLVMDNSCSMANNQEDIANSAPTFFGFFQGSNIDFHVGVISTDTDNTLTAGVLQTAEGLSYITSSVPDPSQVFGNMIRLGTAGSASERGLEAVYRALGPLAPAANKGFRRDTAALHVVVVSDEDDLSRVPVLPDEGFTPWFLDLPAPARSFSSIVCLPGCTDLVPGERYIEVTDAVGGITWSIGDDWDEVLEQLAIQSSGLLRVFELSATPIEDTIEVLVDRELPDGRVVTIRFDRAVFDDSTDPPQLVDGEWVYDASDNTIAFQNFLPSVGNVVRITYDVK